MSPRQKLTTTGGRTATTRHIFGERVLSVGMPINQPTPTGWRWVPLSEVATMESGHTPSREHPEYWNGDIPWLGVRDAGKNHGTVIDDTSEHTNQLGVDNSSARLLPAGTVCLSRGGTVGYVVMIGRPMCTSQGFANWICGEELEPRFLLHLLLSEKNGLDKFSIGTTIQTIYYPDLKALHICIPSIGEQKRIVKLLDEAFQSIAKARTDAEENLMSSRALFESCLQEAFTEVPADPNSPSRDKGNNSKRRWNSVPLGELSEVIAGQSPEGKYYNDEGSGAPFYQGKKDFGDKFIQAPTIWTTQVKKIAKKGDILMSVRAPVGPVNFATSECCIGRGLAAIRIKGDLDSLFLYYQLKFLEPTISGREGVVFPSINKLEIESLPISVGPLSEQLRTVERIGKIESGAAALVDNYKKKIVALENLKHSLSAQAFSGNFKAAR